jgi:predicted transcriptional regulator
MDAIREDLQGIDDNLLARMTADVVSAYVENNPVPAAELQNLIASVHSALKTLDSKSAAAEAEKPEPAVNPKRSVRSDHVVCLECGKQFKSIKRHLGTHHDMTPEDYRSRWNLPADYPMVAPEYAEKRSALAKSMGLGRKPGAKGKSRRKK